MMLFNVMLLPTLKAQRSGQIRGLYCFPLLFLVWANLHYPIHFTGWQPWGSTLLLLPLFALLHICPSM